MSGKIPQCSAEVAGFSLVRVDRDKQSGKKSAGGYAVFVKDKCCNQGHVTTKLITCTPDIELGCGLDAILSAPGGFSGQHCHCLHM